jgi:arylformamidase
VPGVDQNLTSLDIHAPSAPCDAPVVMWVHGGGYRIGDKSNQVRDKIKLFNDHGWIFVSVNYRLTRPGQPGSAQFPDHYDDVAAAVAWSHAHIASYGGDPSRIALLGHSAGADIVSNVATIPTYLQRQGLDLSAIRCAGPLDTEGFDKAAAAPAEKQQWVDALGNDPNYVVDTSATLHVATGLGIPSTIGVYRGSVGRQRIETAYLDTLTAEGVAARRIDARTLSHEQVNTQIGAPGDTVMTPPLVAFLTTCFAK